MFNPDDVIEWVEPFDEAGTPVWCRMSAANIVKTQRAKEPRYTSDQQALDDFLVVHWAHIVPHDDLKVTLQGKHHFHFNPTTHTWTITDGLGHTIKQGPAHSLKQALAIATEYESQTCPTPKINGK